MASSNNASCEEVTSAVFIDVPNIRTQQGHAIPILWGRLIQTIDREELRGTFPVHMGAYAGVTTEAEQVSTWFTGLKSSLLKLGVNAYGRADKDIDSWIINDIWLSVMKTQIRAIEKTNKLSFPFIMRHVLVSGDGGYLRAYDSLLETMGECVEIDLVVYSWNRSLHPQLRDRASHVVYLDDLDLVRKE